MSDSQPAPLPEFEEAPACELRQAQFGLFLLRILQPDWWSIQGYVADRVASAPGLLEDAAVVLDVDALAQWPSSEQAADLLDRLRAAGLQPIALATAPGEQAKLLSQRFGLPSVPTERGRRRAQRGDAAVAVEPVANSVSGVDSSSRTSGKRDRDNHETVPVASAPEQTAAAAPDSQPASVDPPAATEAPRANDAEAAAETAPPPAASSTAAPMLVSQPVRSGQQLYARGRDLIVTAAVSAGAEVIADGSIHVYGRLAGKALAGARGNEQARIYCLDFQPELVSVAGHYRLLESIPDSARGHAVQVLLEGDKLDIRPLHRGPAA